MTGKVKVVQDLLERVEDIISEMDQCEHMEEDLAIVRELADQLRDELQDMIEE